MAQMDMDQEKLAAALKARDPAAMQQLVEAFGQRLTRSAYLLCGNENEAQDLAQDTFVEAFRSAHRFQGRSSVYTWLHSILLNLTRHYRRKRKKLIYDNELAAQEISAPEEHPSALDVDCAATELAQALQRLSEPHREVLVLRYYERLQIAEIAQSLGVSPGTVKSRVHYAIQEMQKLLPAEMNLFGAGGTNEMETK
jgi:RNA polymerase sigma-70 factor (ECF subfamily)